MLEVLRKVCTGVIGTAPKRRVCKRLIIKWKKRSERIGVTLCTGDSKSSDVSIAALVGRLAGVGKCRRVMV